MGIELEIDEGTNRAELASKLLDDYSDSETKFYIKTDSSLNHGLEIVSHPMTLEHHKSFNWDMVLKDCIRHGFRSHNTSTCGIHIHVPKSFLTYSESIRLAIFVNTNTRMIESVARRSDESSSRFKLISKKHLKTANSNFQEGRYQAINWNNSNTIEFRFFKGTLKHSTFISCLEFIDSICNFIKQVNTSQIYSGESILKQGKRYNGTPFREEYLKSDLNQGAVNLYRGYVHSNKKTYSNLLTYLNKRGVFTTCA